MSNLTGAVNLSLFAIVFSSNLNCTLLKHPAKINMHERGIKPQSPTWQARIPPLNHSCSVQMAKSVKVGDQEKPRALKVRQ